MKSRWSDAQLQAVLKAAEEDGQNLDLATRVYTTRLLGSDPELVLHGGGNTSVKTTVQAMDGSEIDAICVKGSGWDMGTIEAPGLPALQLAPLRDLVKLETMTDMEMVREQRRLLLDPNSPNPSVEAILHALIPAKHVDHTHANAIVGITNQPNGEALTHELFPESIIVPYVMPGFILAKACAKYLAENPKATSMVLLKHGIFTWSDDAHEAYEDMIALVDRAEKRLAQGDAKPFTPVTLPPALAKSHEIAPILRGALAQDSGLEGASKRLVLVHRTSDKIMNFCNADNLSSLVNRGNATPEHVIHIKRTGVALPPPEAGKLDAFAASVEKAVADFEAEYTSYFERNNARAGGGLTMLDAAPRVFYVQGVGIFAAGKSLKGANVAADVVEATIDVITAAEGIDSFEALPENDLFDLEYWSLEQIKLAKVAEQPLSRQVALVTGAAGGLGLEIAKALKAQGAEVAMMDIAADRLAEAANDIGGFAVPCDVTSEAAVDKAVAKVTDHFGGIDILMSNAGAAFQGAMVELETDEFRKAFDLNFWSHHYVARAVVRVLEAQGTGGALVFNISKQSVNPGPDFGPYGTSKAALMALMKQYAVEHGESGITSNGVNADRIRTGLLTDDFVAARSHARGVTPEHYMRGNLLKREVLASDVAEAFVHLAKARTTTGAVVTVDGGNVAAMMR
jgi:rhamnose utilization protein RhaD (predicted bifunctional aldolase and dehydrogenase)/NAD(P)-dependent dehydrogenase (short-subunit alcohol dehydrogenase family)